MLTDTKLRNLKPRDKLYKVNDREGLYVAVTPAGSISFRYNYSINGRQETITFGRYGVGGITLAEARELLGDAKKMVAAGKSPAKEKARDKARVKDAETFGAWAEKWLRGYQMAQAVYWWMWCSWIRSASLLRWKRAPLPLKSASIPISAP